MKDIKTKISMVVLFLLSFMFFLYWSFPYGVLKEMISTQIQLSTGTVVRIGELGPAFPFGFRAEDLEIGGSNGKNVQFQTATVRVNLLSLLLLNLSVNLELVAKNNGSFDGDVAFSIPAILKGGIGVPSKISFTAKSFPLDDLVSYGIRQAASHGLGGEAGGSFITAIGFRGKLNGDVSLDLDSSSPAQSTGKVKLAFNDAALMLSHEPIGLPDQVFKSAQLAMDLSGGVLKIDPATRFTGQELDLGADGRVTLKNPMGRSEMDVKVFVKLSGGLSEKFGWVMEGLPEGVGAGGNLNMQIRGTFDAPDSPLTRVKPPGP